MFYVWVGQQKPRVKDYLHLTRNNADSLRDIAAIRLLLG
jgi:hypothetical protein